MGTLIASIADMHSGGTTSLFPNCYWQGEHQNHTPTPNQIIIHDHFMKCADIIGDRGKGKNRKRLVIVNSGDAIEGVHNKSPQVITTVMHEQVQIHIDLMNEFLERCRFSLSAGDRLVYVRGTENHTGDNEAKIAADLGAEIADHIEVNIGNKKFWFVHKGVGPGSGPNIGNALRNGLKNIYYECLEGDFPIPDYVSYAHVHTPLKGSYEGKRKTIYGHICPSWQMKTRFAYGVAPVARTAIGMATVDITDDEDIVPAKFHLLTFPSAKVV